MKITRIEATYHVVPNDVLLLDRQISWPLVFCRVETDAGMLRLPQQDLDNALLGLIQSFPLRGVTQLLE